MGNDKFTWIPFYEELAEKLLAYKNKRKELIDFIFSPDGLLEFSSYLHLKDKNVKIDDIDPFSFFAMFNRGKLSFNNRITILERIKQRFAIQASVPTDFDGVPVCNFMRMFYYNWNDLYRSCDEMWNDYESIIKEDNLKPWLERNSNIIRKQADSTMPLFWFNAHKYLALDSKNKNYLQKVDLETNATDSNSYENILTEIKKRINSGDLQEKSFAEISFNAQKASEEFVPTELKNIQLSELNDYQKFKCILEYFVAHLEYVENEDTDFAGYKIYIKELVERKKFKKSGFGWKGDKIQKQVENWDDYGFSLLYISIDPRDVTSKGCYLNWKGTWKNVRPQWNKNKNHVIGLYLSQEKKPNAKVEFIKSLGELGLFDNNKPNNTLKEFYDKYREMLDKYNSKQNDQIMNEQLHKYVNLLKSNHNLILTGAPGTGKTYLAKQIAQQMIFGEIKNSMTDEEKQRFNEQCGFVQFHPSYDYTDFVEGLRPFNNDDGQIGFKRKDGVFKNFCERALKSLNGSQQITNFDDVYNLFVDDILEGNSIVLETPKQKRQFKLEVNKNRNFYAIPQTDKATPLPITKELIQVYMESGEAIDWKSYVPAIGDYIKSKYQLLLKKNTYNKDAKYIFIIDEINRGEISKIFGELFFAIDPGYRGSEKCSDLRTQYANLQESSNEFDRSLNISESNNYGHFFVPENVYIIGTMNDIDRSVESMDFAFRRRFAFKEIKADENVGMLDGLQEKEDAIKRMKRLNDEISKIEGLSSAYHIGASYFLKLESYDADFDKLWEYHLEGLLREYLRGMPDIEGNIKKLKDAYNDTTADNGQLPVQSDAE